MKANERTHLARTARGFIIQELIVALIVFGVAIVPMVWALSRLPELSTTVGQQSRREAWRSTMDQMVAVGIDPEATGVMARLAPQLATSQMNGTVRRVTLRAASTTSYAAQVVVISDAFTNVAEERVKAAGFEIGPSLAPTRPNRENPLTPLPPRKLAPPTIASPSAPYVQLSELRATGVAGAPFVADVVANGSDLVQLRQTAPRLAIATGTSTASLTVDAVELAKFVRGEAWTEYPGDPATDIAIPLSGNRTRWLVQRGRQFEAVDPSDPVTFEFGVNLGRPIYRIGSMEYPSGSVVGVDYLTALEIESGRLEARIDYPNTVRQIFGSQWASVEPGIDWSFGLFPGNSSAGNTATYFSAAGRRLWQPSQTVRAEPITALNGLPRLLATWTVQRNLIQLAPPERTAGYYDGLTDAPGAVEFSAPVLSNGAPRVGRPEIGGVQSTDSTLAVIIIP